MSVLTFLAFVPSLPWQIDRFSYGNYGNQDRVLQACTPGCAVALHQFTTSCGDIISLIDNENGWYHDVLMFEQGCLDSADPLFFLNAIKNAQVRKRPLFHVVQFNRSSWTKTGSGQAQGNLNKRAVFAQCDLPCCCEDNANGLGCFAGGACGEAQGVVSKRQSF